MVASVSSKGCVISSFITKPQLLCQRTAIQPCCVISSFITKPQHAPGVVRCVCSCVISSFITKPQREIQVGAASAGCVISSFITKPQRDFKIKYSTDGCVISSFITKPQQPTQASQHSLVALYPLSSPNHNIESTFPDWCRVALYPLSSPNHNASISIAEQSTLRYILFHHQTTTYSLYRSRCSCCVISSFITKPQQMEPF